jgi:hypothetical protein
MLSTQGCSTGLVSTRFHRKSQCLVDFTLSSVAEATDRDEHLVASDGPSASASDAQVTCVYRRTREGGRAIRARDDGDQNDCSCTQFGET